MEETTKEAPARSDAKSPLIQWVLYLVAISAAAIYFADLRFALNIEYEHAPLTRLLDNLAHVPFQYRVLIPWLIHWIDETLLLIIPYYSPYHVASWIEALSVICLLIAYRYFLSSFFNNRITTMMLSFLLLYVLSFHYLFPRINKFWYPSDIPSVLFFTLGMILIYKRKWLFYYPLFIVATLNRETTCFLTILLLLVWIGRIPTSEIFRHCYLQFIIWVGIKLGLYWLYLNNPGKGLFEGHLITNLKFLANPEHYPFLASIFGFTWIPVAACYKRIKAPFVKRSLYLVIPFILPMIYVGNIYELRIYGELSPIILTACLLVFRDIFTHEQSPRKLP